MIVSEDNTSITIRRVEPGDAETLQTIFNEIVKEGTTFLTTEAASLQRIRQMWLSRQTEAYVACDRESGEIIGAYLLKPNAHGREHTSPTQHTWSRQGIVAEVLVGC